ncbi:MAG: amylo-alpha-1,6-glucosidase [Bacteroidales bacterium]|jgi:predicted glycogen debranching enzyme|nr:amylo-alpha-1,6-glucosidase [Bacteroidales bacterium]
MNYIEFNQEKLVNLAFSGHREILRCSGTGAFANSTLSGLNTRKYHGLFIVPQENVDGERHLLVASLNEVIVINQMEFHIGIQQYKGGIIAPKGHKYLQSFRADTVPTYDYKVGKFHFSKSFLFEHGADRLLLKYTIVEDPESAVIRFQPLLAFRQIHRLTRENPDANTQYLPVNHGVGYCLYPDYTPVFLQCSIDDQLYYEHEPVWYKNFEYAEEIKRGYDGIEDLLCPGKMNVQVKNKEIYLAIGTSEINPEEIEHLYNEQLKYHTARSTYFNCLQNAAEQFIVKRNHRTEVIAGYPWFGRWGRDTFIALPGLTLDLAKPELCKEIIDSMLPELEHGLFPNVGQGEQAAYNSVDAPLWFIRALQQYTAYTKNERAIWGMYGTYIKKILDAYTEGSLYHIRVLPNGLIHAGNKGVALTWMDAVINGEPVTPRTGCPVEINGLWYNAVRFAIEMARVAKDHDFADKWKNKIQTFPAVFKDTFWSKEHGYLADFVNGDDKNFQVRPNMLIITSLPYSPVSEKIKQLILKKTLAELLTDKGVRTLSPSDPDYKGRYEGGQENRDRAYHQGTCWPWLLAPLADGLLTVYQKSALPMLEKMLYRFEPCMKEYGISTIAEIYDGDPPHRPNGAISQAWSVSALLHIKALIEHGRVNEKYYSSNG